MSQITTQYDLVSRNKTASFFVIAIFISVLVGVGYLCYLAEIAPLEVMAICFFVSAAWSFISYFFSDRIILSYSNAHPANKKEHYNLYTVTENLCLGANLPFPKLYVMADPALNAFATGRNPQHAVVCVTTGLLNKLDRHELEAVVAHELSHIRHYDILLSSLIAVMAGALTMTVDIMLRTRVSSRSRREREQQVHPYLIIFAYVLAILAPIILNLLQLALSRKREFLADAGSVELTRNPQAMINALTILSHSSIPVARASGATAELYIVNPFKKKTWFHQIENLWATHPPLEDRIAALQQLVA